jgi:NAD(P)-dependent dehydrogenase (short-subunit alcohol dehydrogenase family)
MTSLFDVSGKTVLVTGGTSGIGEMIARGFLDAGASVIAASRKVDVGEAMAAELDSTGRFTFVQANLSTEDECRRLAKVVASVSDHLDVLVNNAGATWGAPMDDYDEKAFERVMSLNVKAVFHLTKFLRPLLEARATADQPSRVINIGSIDGLRAPAMETYAYSASKAAVHQLTRHLAKFLAPTITVNAIAPGPFESRMMHATIEAFGEDIVRAAPLKRLGRDDDMAGTAIFLASPAASYITGAVIPVDGGIATLA